MPFTPFHFGAGAAIHALTPRHVSFLAFVAANVLIDVETLYFLLANQYPWHRFFHTLLGASLVALATVCLFVIGQRVASPLRLSNVFYWQDLRVWPVVAGAFIGTCSHVALDSVVHPDVRPFAPFSDASPLLNTVSMDAVHWSCFLAGVAGAALLGVRQLLRVAADRRNDK